MQSLRSYQARAVEQTRAHWTAGRRRVLLISPTGSGKTRMGEELCLPFPRVAWFAHRRELIGDASRRLAAALGALDVGVIAPGVDPSPYSRVQVSTIQTALARNVRPPADLVVVDECFPGWVEVGGRRIDSIFPGDLVPCVDHSSGELCLRPVVRVMRKEAASIVRIKTNARMFDCTTNHPIFVKDKGYVEAQNIVHGDLLCVLTDFRRYEAERRKEPQDVRGQVFRSELIGDYDAHQSSACEPADESAKPDAQRRVATEDASIAARGGSPAGYARRQRETTNNGGDCRFGRARVAAERDRSDRSTGERASEPLQTGRSESTADDSYRGGWGESRIAGPPGSGPEKRGVLVWERVESVAYSELGSAIPVWNIEVEGAHTYFANGTLVHNCHHIVADDWNKVLGAYPEAMILLLTATPERQDGRGMSEVADTMVVAADYSELLEAGHLTSVRVFRPEQILGNALAQDPVDAWLRHAEGSPGFAFFGSVDHAYKTEHQMNAAGIRAAVIEQGTKREDRLRYIEQLKNGDLDCICNVYTMTEGVDVPRARVCMLASACRHCGGYLQKAGRVLRPHESKPNAILIDLVGASILHGLPTEDRVYSLDGEPIKRKNVVPLKSCPSCGATIHAQYATCPECAWVFAPEKKRSNGPRIFSLELIEVFAGLHTPPDAKRQAYAELRAKQKAEGYELGWVQVQYKRVFIEGCIISDATNDEKRAELAKLKAIAKSKGFKPGFVGVNFNRMFGHWPS